MMLFRSIFIFFIPLLLAFPFDVYAAQILQVRNSSTLQIGDRNRSYTVKLACLEVNPLDEIEAKKILNLNLKRGTRVQLNPQGSENGVLIARVIPIESEIDLTQSIVNRGLGKRIC